MPSPASLTTSAAAYHEYLDSVEQSLEEGIAGFWLGRATELGDDRLALAFSGMLPIDLRLKVREDVVDFLLEVLVPAWTDAYASAGGRDVQRYLQQRVVALQNTWSRDQVDALERAGAILGAHHGEEDADPQMLASLYGLTSVEAVAVANYEVSLVSKNLTRRALQYARESLRRRARRVATYEPASAYNAGEDEVARSVWGVGNYVNVWRVDPLSNVCKRCAGMDGQEVQPGQAFSEGVETAPLHPECRCRVEKKTRTF